MRQEMFSTKEIVMVALVTAIICVLGPLSIPIGPVPISLTNFALLLGVYVLGWKKGCLSYLLYLLIGLVGIPVFSGFSAGVSKVAGPTGGYLIGFLFLVLLSGWFIERFPKKTISHTCLCLLGMVLGTVVLYVFGTVWFVEIFSSDKSSYRYSGALSICVWPFLPGDLLKIAIVAVVGPRIREQLKRI